MFFPSFVLQKNFNFCLILSLTYTLYGYIMKIPLRGILRIYFISDKKQRNLRRLKKSVKAAKQSVSVKAVKQSVSVKKEKANMTEDKIDGEKNCIKCDCVKTKHRDKSEYDKLINRLNRIEGQIRGIKSMVEKDAYCTDILMQVSAATAALNSFNKELLANHIRTCVTDDIIGGKKETVDELVDVLYRLMR